MGCPKVVLAIFFLTPKMFELKEEEEYKEITDIVINFYLNRFWIKCGYETKEVRREHFVICKSSLCRYRFSIFKGTICENARHPIITVVKILDLWFEGVPFSLLFRISNVHRSAFLDLWFMLQIKRLRSFFTDI